MTEIVKMFKLKMILDAMMKYQKENNITRECVTNVQFLYRIVKTNFPELSVKAIPIIYFNDFRTQSGDFNDIRIQAGHLVLEIEGMGFIECSYDMLDRLKTSTVYKTVKECVENEPFFANKEAKKMLIEKVLYFQKIANDMNEGETMINDFNYFAKLYACCVFI